MLIHPEATTLREYVSERGKKHMKRACHGRVGGNSSLMRQLQRSAFGLDENLVQTAGWRFLVARCREGIGHAAEGTGPRLSYWYHNRRIKHSCAEGKGVVICDHESSIEAHEVNRVTRALWIVGSSDHLAVLVDAEPTSGLSAVGLLDRVYQGA
ncbi:MAG: hypothetical protein C0467_21595 [Planctomycetaceae bacterium]|nr:hypothetical protein [Planctomycetaceae bacterium]